MGTRFFRAGNLIGNTVSTRLVSITTGPAQLLSISSGFYSINLMNNGPAPVSFGDSSLLMGSGNMIFPYAQYEFLNVSDDWKVYMRADSAATTVAITEFRI